jgi:predicted nucleotidyltransferase
MVTETRISPEMLANIVQKIVVAVQPKRILLFGSGAKGRMGPDSDVALLVIMPDGIHRRRMAQDIYRSLTGLGMAKDIVVATESDVRDHDDNPSLVLFPALREGTELYRAAG